MSHIDRSVERDAVVLENPQVHLVIDDSTGAIAALADKSRGREYINKNCIQPPFRVAFDDEMVVEDYHFFADKDTHGMTLTWEMKGARLTACITLLSDGISVRSTLDNNKDICIKAFEYPILGPLADYGLNGFLAHSYATGVLLQDPLSQLPEFGPLRYTPYPESFSGAAMQFFTYYEEHQGGLYFAALDSQGHQKWLNVYKQDNGLNVSHMTGFENVVPGGSIDMEYNFVVRFTSGRGWQEAANLYKPWALEQIWCKQGLARDRRGRADWLREKVGYCTFGVNAGLNREKWLLRYHKDIGTPGFHVLGPDWTNTPQTFGYGVPGDMCDWLPTNVDQDNIEAIRDNGDYFALFEFDFLVGMNKSNPEKLKPFLQIFPKPSFSHDEYKFSMLCPYCSFTKTFHRERDIAILKETHADAMYYDISANNLIKICLAENHGHLPGGGKEIADAYASIYEDTALALRKEALKQIPLGTEMINEIYLPYLDFYQARAWAQPGSTLETWPFREQMKSGMMQMIPLFDYVYHEMGAVRMDGWGKLVGEIGELFFYNAAKVYLWGGLYEINHEYSPMEELDGQENSGEEHYFHFDPQNYKYASERAAYIGQFAKLRLSEGNAYLAYGTMTAVPEIVSPEIDLDWYHYNHGQLDSSYQAKGSYRVKAVISSAFTNGVGGWALFLTNVDKSAHEVTFTVSIQSLGLKRGDKSICLLSGFGEGKDQTTEDFSILHDGEGKTITITLLPRVPYMLEII